MGIYFCMWLDAFAIVGACFCKCGDAFATVGFAFVGDMLGGE